MVKQIFHISICVLNLVRPTFMSLYIGPGSNLFTYKSTVLEKRFNIPKCS